MIKSIAANETKLVVIANDASANTKKKITDKCHFYHVDYFIVDENIETISKAVGKNLKRKKVLKRRNNYNQTFLQRKKHQ